MEFYEAIKSRRSISKFKEEEVCEGSLDNIINAAMRAPSWKDKTSYKIVIVKCKDKKAAISKCVKNKDCKCEEAINKAPIVAVFIAEPDKSGQMDGKEYYMVDTAIAMEHFVLAATAEGYGTLWIGALDEDCIKKELEIPDEFKVVAMTPVGVPEEIPEEHPKKNVTDYVFLNKFGSAYTENK